MIDTFISAYHDLKRWSRARRKSIVCIFAIFFICGIGYSFAALNLKLTELDAIALLAVACLVPISILLNGTELQLCARVANQNLGFGKALGYASMATIANLLPIPASILIRGGALVSSGAKIAQAGRILAAAAAMWLAMAFGISGYFLTAGWISGGITILSAILVIGIAFWIEQRSSVATALSFIAVRGIMLLLLIARLYFCFIAINAAVALEEAAIYSVVGIAGTAVAIVPAGLGIAEGFGALIAKAAGADPAAAFLALGLNRILGLLGSGLVAAFFWFRVEQPDLSMSISS
jgi:hypothetical protein